MARTASAVLLRLGYRVDLLACRLLGRDHPAAVFVARRVETERPAVLVALRQPAR